MGNVTIVAPFRDCEGRVEAFADRVDGLAWEWEALRVVAVEGDSADGTRARLEEQACWDPRWRVVRCDTGAPHYGSVVNAERFATLATVYNAGMDAVDLGWSDYVLMLPSDIVYEADMLQRLADDLERPGADLVAPFVFMHNVFYDIWAFSTEDGRGVPAFGRFDLGRRYGRDLVKMQTVGGTLLMRAEVLRAGCRYTAEEVDRGLCRMARALGFGDWAAPLVEGEHRP